MNPQMNSQNSGSPFSTSTHLNSVALSPVDVRLNFIRKTYVLFMAGILASIVMGALTLSVPALHSASLSVWSLGFFAVLILIGAAWGAQAVARIEGVNYAALFGFTGFIGFLFAPIINLYEKSSPGIVGQAGMITVVLFGSLTAYAFVSRTDFSFLRGILFVGLIGLVVASLANAFFFRSWGASYWMAWFTAFLFSGFVLYDTSNIIRRYDERGYCSAALELFLDFFNLFMAILRILAGSRR